MLPTEEQNEKAKRNIKTAWDEGDLLGLACAGIDNLLNMLCHNPPISFQRFLEYTGASFDTYILDVTQQEHLSYVGGKMLLELEKTQTITPTLIQLSADFYFQTPDKKWIVKKKKGKIESSRFTDWNVDVDAVKLQRAGKLELSIEPPELGAK